MTLEVYRDEKTLRPPEESESGSNSNNLAGQFVVDGIEVVPWYTGAGKAQRSLWVVSVAPQPLLVAPWSPPHSQFNQVQEIWGCCWGLQSSTDPV